MDAEPVRIKVTKGWKRREPRILAAYRVYPPWGRPLVNLALRLPHGRLRRALIEWALREGLAGTFNRRTLIFDAVGSPDLEFAFAPELAGLLGYDDPVVRGPAAATRFVQEWWEAWGDVELETREVIDLGDRRVMVLHLLHARGATSGVEVKNQEEAQLWQWGRRGFVYGRQWWNWREALGTVGLPPTT